MNQSTVRNTNNLRNRDKMFRMILVLKLSKKNPTYKQKKSRTKLWETFLTAIWKNLPRRVSQVLRRSNNQCKNKRRISSPEQEAKARSIRWAEPNSTLQQLAKSNQTASSQSHQTQTSTPKSTKERWSRHTTSLKMLFIAFKSNRVWKGSKSQIWKAEPYCMKANIFKSDTRANLSMKRLRNLISFHKWSNWRFSSEIRQKIRWEMLMSHF